MVRNKKKWLIITGLVICVLAISLPLSACQPESAPTPAPVPMPTPTGPAPAPAPEVYKFRMQTLSVTQDPTHSKDAAAFVERAKALSNGAIDITLFPVNEIVPMFEMFDAVEAGSLDISLSYGGWWAGKLGPASEVDSGLPVGVRNAVEIDSLYFSEDIPGRPWLEIIREVYAKGGVQYIGPVFGGSATIVSNKPLDKISDFQGFKTMESAAEAKYYQMLGAKTVSLPAPELYTSLSTGVVDGIGWAGPAKMYGTFKLMEIAQYIQWPAIAHTRLNVMMNMDKWNELPDNLKRVLEEACRILFFEYGERGYNLDIQWIGKAQQEYGVKITGIPMEERWPYAKQLRDEYAASDPLAKEMLDREEAYLKILGYIK
ncbi:TRAP transporter substrate-binding protein DctP [Chloroflexota bacterium]